MKNKFKYGMALLVISLTLIGCKEKDKNGEVLFQALVLENDNRLLVSPVEESSERKSSDQIVVGTEHAVTYDDNNLEIEVKEIQEGDLVEITYDGIIRESYPAMIDGSKIVIVSRGESELSAIDNSNNMLAWEKDVNTIEGVSMNIIAQKDNEMSIEITSQSEEELLFGSDFLILREHDGVWYNLPYVNGDIAFTSEGYSVAKGESINMDMNWSYMYGKLEHGDYRLVKSVIIFTENGDYNTSYIATDFSITESISK